MRNSKKTNERGSNNVNGWLLAVNYRLGCRLVVCFLRLCTLKEPPLRQKFENSRAFRLMLTELIRRRLLLLLSEDERNGNDVQFELYCKNWKPVVTVVQFSAEVEKLRCLNRLSKDNVNDKVIDKQNRRISQYFYKGGRQQWTKQLSVQM
ncbi:hypothetical protein T11_3827 [Trichinella zimbabwensis]|uniref:Uncharacterized protein n=1 Tax=Trichinella zimbabwensis TaxID=268475 RepID=A0A0V1GY40_9BILA|nr:hypothetical protein T11_3827 [Trichinella zimbabwensis]